MGICFSEASRCSDVSSLPKNNKSLRCILYLKNFFIDDKICIRGSQYLILQNVNPSLNDPFRFLWQIAISYHGDDNIHTTAFLKTGIPAPSQHSTAPTKP